MEEKKYIVSFQIMTDTNTYKKSPICQFCKRDFSKCDPKCDSFYFALKQKRKRENA